MENNKPLSPYVWCDCWCCSLCSCWAFWSIRWVNSLATIRALSSHRSSHSPSVALRVLHAHTHAHTRTHTYIHAGTTVHAINYTSSRVGVELLLPIITIARCAYFCHSAPGRVKKVPGSPYSIAERRVPELIPVLGSQPAGGWRES